MRKIQLIGVASLIIANCSLLSHKQSLPPPFVQPVTALHKSDTKSVNLFLQNYEKNSEDRPSKWWAWYNLALIWRNESPTKSCKYFSDLAKLEGFPIHDLARLRSIEFCPATEDKLKKIWEISEQDQFPWLRQLAIEVGVKKARELKNDEMLMKLSFEAAKISKFQREKKRLALIALKLAKQAGNMELVSEIYNYTIKIAPRLNPSPTEEDYIKMAYDYRINRKFQKARQYYRKSFDRSGASMSEKYSALIGIRKTFRLQDKKSEYRRATGNLAKWMATLRKKYPKDSLVMKKFRDAHILFARTLWTLGKNDKSVRVLRKLARSLKNLSEVGQVYYLESRIAEEKGRFKQSINWLNKAMQTTADPEFLERIKWKKAWNLRKLGQFNEAIDLFEHLIKKTENSFQKVKYVYWLARTLQRNGRLVEAHKQFEILIEEDPVGYYGVLAHRALNLNFPSSIMFEYGPGQWNRVPASKMNVDTLFTDVEWMLAVGEFKSAKNFLDYISNKDNLTKSQREKILIYYARSGHYLRVFQKSARMPLADRRKFLSENPELIFPRPFYGPVSDSAVQFGMSVELIYSVIRQESAFNTMARSSADAFGLMQLLPQIARITAKEFNIDLGSTYDLYQPHVNIPLGAAYLRRLWDKYNGQFILTVASYNASEDVVRNWVKSRFTHDPIEFIEDIPYDETQSYVKLVLRNLVFYMRLNSREEFIPFPEWCLQGLQDFKS